MIASPQILPDQTAVSAIAFLGAALDYYAQLSIRVRRSLTDNLYCYRSRSFSPLLSNSS